MINGMDGLRVLHLYHDILENGGVENFLLNVCTVLRAAGVYCDVTTTAFASNDYFVDAIGEMGYGYYQLNKNKKNFVKGCRDTIKRLPAFLRAHRYDIVHVHSCSPIQSGIIMRILRRNGVRRVIHHAHLSSENMGASLAFKWRIKRLLGVPLMGGIPVLNLSPSRAAARSLFPAKVFKAGKVEYVPNAVDTGKFAFDEIVRANMRQELGIGVEEILVGHVGRFDVPKNHSFTMDVFYEMLRRRPACRLVLVGEGAQEAAIRQKAARLGLQDKVIFYGATNEMERLLQAFDVFLFPSLFEALGIAAVEAQAAGLPCVASTNVPRQAVLCESTIQLSRACPAGEWAEAILKTRRAPFDPAALKAYDIRTVAAEMQGFYESLSVF